MSWAEYVNNALIGSGAVSKGAILGLDGSIWGKSDNFQISSEEALAAARGMSNPENFLASGAKFEGEKYVVLRAEDDRLIGKKAANGFFLYKTLQVYENGMQAESCSQATGRLADYLKTLNY